jgi:OmcA/MtrC family decaheme c-type cytochrome
MMRPLGWIGLCIVLGTACMVPPGEEGREGRQGPEGDRGEVGTTGPTGDTGDTGPAGGRGAPGDDGADGATGPRGPEGTEGDPGEPGAPGDDGVGGIGGELPPIDTTLNLWDDQPGLVVEIVEVVGGTRADGTFRAGDTLAVTFTATLANGTPVPLAELDGGGIYVSGPSSNYQRVISRQGDVVAKSVTNPDGSHTYTFAAPIPTTYLPPYNDSGAFGLDDGEWQGLTLDPGTYTVGLELSKFYLVGDEETRDAGNATADFLFGGATAFESHEVVGQNHCASCHAELRAHGGTRRDVKLCVLCHTAGAEDKNEPLVEGGTPGVSTEFRVMVHKIHNGAHLPSVLGMSTNPDGSRNYTAAPAALAYVGFGNGIDDFAHVNFPVFPNFSTPMPQDQGHALLSAPQKALENAQRSGVTACFKCHGDPDDAGPLAAPADGDRAYSAPSRQACGSCHDDIDWSHPYVANGMTMLPQASDAACSGCHAATGATALAVDLAHLHPLHDPAANPGLHVELTGVTEAGSNDGDDTLDPGEQIEVTFTVQDDDGAALSLVELASLSAILSGPTWNYNLLLSTSIPTAALGAGPNYTTKLPEPIVLDYVGDAGDDGAIEAFVTARAPHWNVTGATTTVYERTATSGGTTTTAGAAAALQNYVDVADATGFARNDYLVVDDGGAGEEYSRVALVDGARLWLTKPLGLAHAAGDSVLEVTLTSQVLATDYTLDAPTGTVTEAANASFGAGNAIVVSYTSDYVVPAVYPAPLNDSPDLDETWGEWKGKVLVGGTYSLGVWGYRNLCVKPDKTAVAYTACTTGQPDYDPDNTSYRGTSEAHSVDVLVGDADTIEPFETISSGENCNACHEDLSFHGGGRRGFDWCILCHGTAGSEDRARYTAGNAPATPGATINFRTMLHKIHRGRDLVHAEDYTIVGYGAGAYPNNYTAYQYGEIGFPAQPGGVLRCAKCHGASEAWHEPRDRAHPTEQGEPERVWRAVCGACHDSDAAGAHIAIMTDATGQESCAVCHGPGRALAVEIVHKPR